jgi:hypothetical protein
VTQMLLISMSWCCLNLPHYTGSLKILWKNGILLNTGILNNVAHLRHNEMIEHFD